MLQQLGWLNELPSRQREGEVLFRMVLILSTKRFQFHPKYRAGLPHQLVQSAGLTGLDAASPEHHSKDQ